MANWSISGNDTRRPKEEWRPTPIWASIQSAICEAGLPPENKIWFTRTRISSVGGGGLSMWQGHIDDRGLRIALLILRWSKIISAASLACCWCTGFGPTLPPVEKIQTLQWCVLSTLFPLSQLFEDDFLKICCICMRKELCIPESNGAFYEEHHWAVSHAVTAV